MWYLAHLLTEEGGDDRAAFLLHKIVPQLRPISLHTESRVTSYTRTGYPHADMLPGGRIGVLIGGNGSAAKSADEIGRMGAEMRSDRSFSAVRPPYTMR